MNGRKLQAEEKKLHENDVIKKSNDGIVFFSLCAAPFKSLAYFYIYARIVCKLSMGMVSFSYTMHANG